MSKQNLAFILKHYFSRNCDFVLVGDTNVFYENAIDKNIMSIHHYLIEESAH